MTNLPAGAENDPRAPYNQKTCPECDGKDDSCSLCGGDGEVDPDTYAEWLRDKRESWEEDQQD